MHRTAQMAGNEPFGKKWTRFCENYFLGKGFAKPRLMFLKFGGDFEFRPRGGRVWEGIRAGFGFLFWRALKKKIHNIEISAKPRYEICIVLDPPSRSRTNPRRF
ncbi:MAG: hypothetical protein CO139_03900 [Candidatus Moranbacteria bacterium CG_4_9_14_3_um_filter_36_9]|nr:MAG: hypothetical protein CO139_03900 [Candidatus Moranbacteria bacterium CG_4_9_14_3_um_filter_36_9]